MEKKILYPIGQQSFEVLRNRGAVYIDKTRFIRKLNDSGVQYYFLARPRRFGKSLFLNTLKCFYQGKRHLFKGLDIDSYPWKWEEYPVLHLDLNVKKYDEEDGLEPLLDKFFHEWEEKYHIEKLTEDLSVRFLNIIEGAHRATGKQVIILVDEYDKPLVGNLNNQTNFEHYRYKLAGIYTNFKNAADHIKLVFLTGVSRFSKLNIFSGLNNILDITLMDDFNDICGITEEELHLYFRDGITLLGQKEGYDYEWAAQELKRNYDGYRFSRDGIDIYNPWSVLNALNAKMIDTYWNDTGIPTLIAESLRKTDVDLRKYFNAKCSISDLKGMDLTDPDPLAVMYQAGYLTIKHYDPRRKRFTLGIPNREVKEGLMNMLLPYYANLKNRKVSDYIWTYTDLLEEGNAEGFMNELQAFFAGITYQLKMDNENNFQNAVYVFLSLIGLEVNAEEETSDGRIDILLKTDKYVYIIELKYDGTPHEALEQIDRKRYSLPYEGKGRTVIKIGASFDSGTRRIDNWDIRF